MGHHHHPDSSEQSNIGLAFFLNLAFTVIEAIGGVYTNSLAILSDAVHDLGDSLSLGLAWYFQRISKRPEDVKFTHGYRRFSVLGAIINCVILMVGSIFIMRSAIPRLMDPQETEPQGMMILAILGIVFNGLAYRKTHGGHSHNEQVISLHLLEDLLGWVAVLIGAIIIHYTGWYIIDPILSLGISLFIIINVYRQIKATLNIILQGTPDAIDLDGLMDSMRSLDAVCDVHDMRAWTMDGQHNIATAHIVVPADTDINTARSIKVDVHGLLATAGIHHSTLEIERIGEDCLLDLSISKEESYGDHGHSH